MEVRFIRKLFLYRRVSVYVYDFGYSDLCTGESATPLCSGFTGRAAESTYTNMQGSRIIAAPSCTIGDSGCEARMMPLAGDLQ
jgi:hypothetical protein